MSGRRATSLSPPERFLLEQWARTVREAFGHTPYLVGSVARADEWRDVDVRLMLDVTDIEALFSPEWSLRLATLNVAFSVWGQRATGLPIDFQFQRTSDANAQHAGGPRIPLGLPRAGQA